MRIWPAVLVFAAAGASVAAAQQRVDPAAFGRDPARFLNQNVRINGLGCWSADGSERCTSYKGVYIVPDDVAPAAVKRKILQDCGGIVEAESDPSCTFDLVLTPIALSRGSGSIVKGDQVVETQVWMVRAAVITATAHR